MGTKGMKSSWRKGPGQTSSRTYCRTCYRALGARGDFRETRNFSFAFEDHSSCWVGIGREGESRSGGTSRKALVALQLLW